MSGGVPAIRVRAANARPPRGDGQFVLYWMIAARRTRWNFALDRALEWCARLGRPLLILEALRLDHPWASERFHRFVIDGMADNARRAAAAGIAYVPYVEPLAGAGSGLLETLAARAAVVVTDEFPSFFLPRMVAAAANRVPVLLEAVDSNGLLPLAAAPKAFERAVDLRRFLQNQLPAHLLDLPLPDPFDGLAGTLPTLPAGILAPVARWPAASAELLAGRPGTLAALAVDHAVGPCTPGGPETAERALRTFVRERLAGYGEQRNDPALEATSGLSPFLHFGHLSAHQTFAEVVAHEGWHPSRLGLERPLDLRGARTGWWGVSPSAEGFLDQLVTWRELGYNVAAHQPGFERYEALPAWARQTLDQHASDPRPSVYDVQELERAATHDPLWNAAQRQLLREGRIHNYLRMLWGKKILEWSPGPRRGLAAMIELNNKYALDGRNPNSYSGISWCLGRYDRPWGPVRPIFGTIRYMSSENTARKLDVKGYLRRFAGA